MHIFARCILICCIPLPRCVWAGGRNPSVCIDHNQGLAHPKLSLYGKPWGLREAEMPTVNICPSPIASTEPPLMFTPEPAYKHTTFHLRTSYKNLLGFQPFYEAFQQIYSSSCSQLHYRNSSNASIKNPALPTALLRPIFQLALRATAQQEPDHFYFCSAPLMRS